MSSEIFKCYHIDAPMLRFAEACGCLSSYGMSAEWGRWLMIVGSGVSNTNETQAMNYKQNETIDITRL